MSGPETPKPGDRLLDEFLAGEGAVRSAYRAATAAEHPPAALDDAILQAAHAVVRAQPRAGRRRWRIPRPALATAAVLMLSFGVFLQVQRDPVAQQQVVAPLDRAAPAAELSVETQAVPATPPAPSPEAAASRTVAKEREAPQSVAKPKPSAAPESERRQDAMMSAPAAPPPPPPAAMADAAPPPKAESAVQAAEETNAMGALASESIESRERFAAAPMAKANRAAPSNHLMRQRDAPVAAASVSSPDEVLEHWAQTCFADAAGLAAPSSWRGLTVIAWSQSASDDRWATSLSFAPDIARETVLVSLGTLAAPAELVIARCDEPVRRELKPSNDRWTLVCECRRPARP